MRIIQEGKEAGQGVGYLDDGTMIVVEDGRRYMDSDVEVVVTRPADRGGAHDLWPAAERPTLASRQMNGFPHEP